MTRLLFLIPVTMDKVATEDGVIGYIKRKALSESKKTKLTNPDYEEETFTHIKKE